MKKMWLWFCLLLKRVLRKPVIMIVLFGIPVVAAVLMNISAFTKSESTRVGIVVSDEDELVRSVVDRLVNGNYPVTFYRENSSEQLTEDIVDDRTLLGYVFSENYTEKLDANNYGQGIMLIKRSSDYISSMINEILYAELFRQYGSRIAVSYVKASELFGSVQAQAVREVEEQYDHYLNGNGTFYLNFESLRTIAEGSGDGHEDDSAFENTLENISSDDSDTAKSLAVFPIRGVMAVLVMAAGILGCVWYKTDEEKGMFITMNRRMRREGMLLYNLAMLIPAAVSAEAVLIVTGTGIYPYEVWGMFLYVLALTIAGIILCILIKGSRLMVSLLPVCIILALVFCPIFIDAGTFIPKAEYISRLLLPYYYLKG